jgi:hypothetical protein
MVICEDKVPDLKLAHGDYTTTGLNRGVKRKTTLASDTTAHARRDVAARVVAVNGAVQGPLFSALVVGVEADVEHRVVYRVLQQLFDLLAEGHGQADVV